MRIFVFFVSFEINLDKFNAVFLLTIRVDDTK